ncbi:MAG: mannose-1-phosphate guanylyltransferase [Deltaproteobacteria bacterium]|nr:mannose-1-phosphate guanylyltransferase [Deltaproteobacteria bacterium]
MNDTNTTDKSGSATPVLDENLVVCILAGGAGTRFWPASTAKKPKQFLRLFSERSMLQQSFDRVKDLVPAERVFVLTSTAFIGLCEEQLPELPKENLIGEPMRRDTSAALALGAMVVDRKFANPVMCVLTADHLIEPIADFQKTLLSAAKGATSSGALYTFGIAPTYAATGFGYLELGDDLDVVNNDDSGVSHHGLLRFVEKPDEKTAASYVESGRFLWNSGMFVWQAKALLDEIHLQIPSHLTHLNKAVESFGTSEFDDELAKGFEPLQKVSIDFGVMENAKDVRCVKAAFSWHDVGSFNALAEHYATDDDDNAHRTPIETLDASGNIVFSENEDETVCLISVQDLIVVRAGNKTLIVPKERGQDIKKLVENLPNALK